MPATPASRDTLEELALHLGWASRLNRDSPSRRHLRRMVDRTDVLDELERLVKTELDSFPPPTDMSEEEAVRRSLGRALGLPLGHTMICDHCGGDLLARGHRSGCSTQDCLTQDPRRCFGSEVWGE